MADNLHKDHRERVRKDFLEHGFSDDIPSHKLLETLLFFAIPREDTNETAHRLLNEFGSVGGVFEADINELLKVKGIGPNSAMLIKLMIPLFKRYKSEKSMSKPKFTNINDICKFIINRYLGETQEVFSVMSFANDGKMLGFDRLNDGDISSVVVSIRDVVSIALKRNAPCVIIAHNHISASALPSDDDVEMTISLKSTLKQMGINLVDHVIVSADDAISMLQTKKYRYIFK